MRFKWISPNLAKFVWKKNVNRAYFQAPPPPPPPSAHNYHDYLSWFILENFSNFLCHNLIYTKLIRCHGRTFIYICCIEWKKRIWRKITNISSCLHTYIWILPQVIYEYIKKNSWCLMKYSLNIHVSILIWKRINIINLIVWNATSYPP